MKALVALLVLCCSLPALEVREVRWGFAGTVVGDRFNPLAILVEQPGPSPFDGMVELSAGTFSRDGAPWVLPVYVAPGTTRWLRFTPWVQRHEKAFTLSWRGGSSELSQPRVAGLQTVAAGESGMRPASGVSVLPDELFPAHPAAWDGLGILLLDHDPAWTAGQREACAMWVRGGGELWLLRGRDGRVARPTGLDDLLANAGAGQLRPTNADLGEARGLLPPPPEVKEPSHGDDAVQTMLRGFGSVVQANHNWVAISLVLVAFVLAVALGPWWLGRRRAAWPLVYGTVLGLVVVTTVALALIGRRGYGEATVTRSLAIARHGGTDRYVVTTIGSSFVTTSGDLTVAHGTGSDLYASGTLNERVDGAISMGPKAVFVSEVPLFTSRHWLHATMRRGPTMPAVSGGSEALRVTLPTGLTVSAGWLAKGALVADLEREGAGLRLPLQPRWQTRSELLQGGSNYSRMELSAMWDACPHQAMAWCLPADATAERMILFLSAEAPAAWAVPGLGRQEGRVLYRFDLEAEDKP